MRRTVSVVATSLLIGLTGCGSEAADLFVVNRSAGVPGGRLALRVTDDGRASCNGAPLVDVTSDQLIAARQVARELTRVGDRRYRPGAAPVFSYRVRAPGTAVAWSDDSVRQPHVLFALAALVREIAKGPCGLPR